MQRTLDLRLGNGKTVSLNLPALSGSSCAPMSLGSVTRSQYLQRIRRAIAYDRMLPFPDEPTEDHLEKWMVETSEEAIICAWIQEDGESVWIVGLLLQALPEYPLENPPKSLDRIIFIQLPSLDEEEIPDRVADASLAALPYAGLMGLPTWAWIAGGVGAIAMVGVVMSSRRR